MKTFNTEREMLEFFNIDNITMIFDSDLFTRHMDNGYDFSSVYTVQTSDAGFVLKAITSDDNILTIDASGEVHESVETLYPSDASAIKTLLKNRDTHADVKKDLEVQKKERGVKRAERVAKAHEKEAAADKKWADAEIEKIKQKNRRALAEKSVDYWKTIGGSREAFAAILYENCMNVVAKFSEPTKTEKQKHLRIAREAITELFKEYIDLFGVEPKLPSRNILSKIINDAWLRQNYWSNTSFVTKGIGFAGKRLTVEMFSKKVKYTEAPKPKPKK